MYLSPTELQQKCPSMRKQERQDQGEEEKEVPKREILLLEILEMLMKSILDFPSGMRKKQGRIHGRICRVR